MKSTSELAVITKTKKLADYVFTVTHKSPKKYRFSIVSRMQNYCLDPEGQKDTKKRKYGLSSIRRGILYL